MINPILNTLFVALLDDMPESDEAISNNREFSELLSSSPLTYEQASKLENAAFRMNTSDKEDGFVFGLKVGLILSGAVSELSSDISDKIKTALSAFTASGKEGEHQYE